MAKRLKALLRSSSGETLVETLCAILICSLAAVALSVSVATATNMNLIAKKTSDEYRETRQQAEIQTGEPAGSTVITVDGKTYPVSVYGGDGVISDELS